MGSTSKRRWFQYSLRTALLLATVFCVGLGWWANRAHQQRRAVEPIKALLGSVSYERRPENLGVPKFARSLLGDDFFVTVDTVYLDVATPGTLDRAVTAMQGLPCPTGLCIRQTTLSDDDLSHLAPLRNQLKSFTVNGGFQSRISGRCIEHFRGWPRLTSLAFDSHSLDSRSLAKLVDLPSLESLTWTGANLDADDFAQIARCQHLRFLNLNQCLFDGQALMELRKAPCLKSLMLGNIHVQRYGLADDEGAAPDRYHFTPSSEMEGIDGLLGPGGNKFNIRTSLELLLPGVEIMSFFHS